MTIFEMSHRMLTYCNHGDNDDDDASGSHVVNPLSTMAIKV